MKDQRTWPTTFTAGTSVTAMRIRKARGGRAGLFGLGGPGRWEINAADGSELARAQDRLVSSELTVDVGGRRLTARMPGILRISSPKELAVVDDTSGQQVLAGSLDSAAVRSQAFRAEEWTFTFSTGQAVTYVHSVQDPRTIGFFDPAGAPVLLIGHDPSFDVGEERSTFRILLRFWGAAAQSTDVYLVQLDASAAGRVVPIGDVPMLAMLGVWLERTVDTRYSTATV
jgi:hypothetical protein